jgi:hypothetical protein
MDGDEEENYSQNSFMSDACGSGDSSSSSDDSEGEPPLPRATSAPASSGGADHVDDGDSNNEVNMSGVSSSNSSTCSGSSAMSPKAGYKFSATIPNMLPRDHKIADGKFFFTNIVEGKYQIMDPVAVIGYPRKWLRFLFVGDIWKKGANTPKHLVYDIKKDSVNHAMPSYVSKYSDEDWDEGDDIYAYIDATYKKPMENKLTDILASIQKRGKLPRILPPSKDLCIPISKSKKHSVESNEPADASGEPADAVDESAVMPATTPRRARGRKYLHEIRCKYV